MHQQLGLSILKRVADELKEDVVGEGSFNGRRALYMILMPSNGRVEKQDEKADDLADAKT
ncbi:MAG: hypothetical protein Ct9H300mP27_05180 [Chloroflexota bacterium]|nr:MAG: hypothetical protein Ct9H300mP27_05180 [Chloroflexota bacterium]